MPDSQYDFLTDYPTLKNSVVAIIGRVSERADVPSIIGTGFFAADKEIVVTNRHVAEAIWRLPQYKGDNEPIPAFVQIFRNLPGLGVVTFTLEISTIAIPELPDNGQYLSETPDMAILRIPYKNLPALKIDGNPKYIEGMDVATSGFPLGHNLLIGDGKTVTQMNQTLRFGKIASVLPFPCDSPTGILVDIHTQGGQSGSPVFNTKTGQVVGLIYASVDPITNVLKHEENGLAPALGVYYRQQSGLTYCVASDFMSSVVEHIQKDPRWIETKPRLKNFEKLFDKKHEQYKAGTLKQEFPKQVDSSEIIKP